jgi:hypothetical protein
MIADMIIKELEQDGFWKKYVNAAVRSFLFKLFRRCWCTEARLLPAKQWSFLVINGLINLKVTNRSLESYWHLLLILLAQALQHQQL